MFFDQRSRGRSCVCQIVWMLTLVALPVAASADESELVRSDRQRINDDRVVTRVYPVKRALQKTRDASNGSMDEAKQCVESYLVGSDGRDETPDLKVAWFGDELIVRQPISAHHVTAERCRSIRKTGVKQESLGTSGPFRHPVSGALTRGPKLRPLSAPSDEQVLGLLGKQQGLLGEPQGGLPTLHETQRNNVRIIKEKIADYVDRPAFYPRVGKAQLHHAHYKCTVHCDKTVRVGWPVPSTTTQEDVIDVLYVDQQHLHVFSGNENRREKRAGVVQPTPIQAKGSVE